MRTTKRDGGLFSHAPEILQYWAHPSSHKSAKAKVKDLQCWLAADASFNQRERERERKKENWKIRFINFF